MPRAVVAALALAILFPLSGCLGGDDPPTETTPTGEGAGADDAAQTTTPAPVEAKVTVTEGAGGIQYGISPAHLELKLGVPVNLTFTNGGASAHDLVIDGLVQFDAIDGGQSATQTFTPTKEGEFPMYCSIGGDGPLGHRERGMAGSVLVSA